MDNIDRVIQIIRGSQNTQIAKVGLMEEFGLSDAQAQAIVDMRLRALTGLEREKIENEYKELLQKIHEYEIILGDHNMLLRVIREEISVIAEKYGDERRTKIGYDVYDISTEDMIPRENTVIAMTKKGYIKRMTVDNFRSQNRGGRGIKGIQTIEDDYVDDLLMTTTHHYMMFFTNLGKAFCMKAYEIPEAGRTARGTAIINLLNLVPGEKVTSVIPIGEFRDDDYLVMVTTKGIVKKTVMSSFKNMRKTGLIAIGLQDNDELIEVKTTDGTKDIILVTSQGMSIRFSEEDVRPTGRGAMGVRGISLEEDDFVVGMQLTVQGDYMLIVSEKGYGKRTLMDEFPRQNRGGKGVKCYRITDKTGNVIGAKAVNIDNDVMLITTEGVIIRTSCEEISAMKRITSGVKVMNVGKDVSVASIAKVREKDPRENNSPDNEENTAEIEDSTDDQND